jgi:hypothetical protein
MKNTEPPKPAPLPAGKPNILWRQSRGGWVCTLSGLDVPGLAVARSRSEAVEILMDTYGPDDARRFSRLLINT